LGGDPKHILDILSYQSVVSAATLTAAGFIIIICAFLLRLLQTWT